MAVAVLFWPSRVKVVPAPQVGPSRTGSDASRRDSVQKSGTEDMVDKERPAYPFGASVFEIEVNPDKFNLFVGTAGPDSIISIEKVYTILGTVRSVDESLVFNSR